MAGPDDGVHVATKASRCAVTFPRTLLATALLAGMLVVFAAGTSASAATDQAVHLWSQAIRSTALPRAGGCFRASYPTVAWRRVRCVRAPGPPTLASSGSTPRRSSPPDVFGSLSP